MLCEEYDVERKGAGERNSAAQPDNNVEDLKKKVRRGEQSD